MLLIQILIVSFALYAFTRALLRFRKRAINLSEFLLWGGFWLCVGVCVLTPGITQWCADLLGVGRGADAVLSRNRGPELCHLPQLSQDPPPRTRDHGTGPKISPAPSRHRAGPYRRLGTFLKNLTL